MNAIKLFLGLVVGVLTLTGLAAMNVYVDVSRPKDSGDGLTWATAFHTIQEGVDAVEAGGTVFVAPGSYDEGTTVAGGHNNRVFIDKSLTLKASGGKTVTEIVGAKDPDTAGTPGLFGVGPKAVRCVLVDSKDNVVIIEGFTLRDGASNSGSDTAANWGGGVSLKSSEVIGPSAAYKTTLVDCTVRDCVGTRGGGVRKIRAVRTLFDNCTCYNSGTKNGGIARDGQFYWCVFRDCPQNVSALSDVTLVNCTVVGCEGAVVQKQASENCVYNTCFALHAGAVGDTGVHLYRSVASNAKTGVVCDDSCKTDSDGYQLLAPALCDFRPIAGGDLDGTGNRDYLANIPEEYRNKDFLGNAVPATGNIAIGAVLMTVAKAGGRLDFANFNSTNVTVTLDGCPIHVPGEYAYAATWPTQYVATVSAASGEELWGWHETSSDTAKFPELTNTKTLLMPAAEMTTTFTYEPILAGRVYYVAPTGDDENNNGLSDQSPLKTLQAAHDKVFQKYTGYTLVHAAEGTYDEGGYNYLNANTRLNIRVPMRYLGAGPGKSIIKGASDAEGADTHSGCGSNAWRCVLARDVLCAVQGFTLADGHTSINPGGTPFAQDAKVTGDGNGIRGGAFYGMSIKSCLVDCVLTNSAASRGSAAYGGRLIRCQIVDSEVMKNSDGNAIFRAGVSWGCTFSRVDDRSSAVLYSGSTNHHCSLSLESENTADLQDPAKVRIYNSLCYGQSFVGKDTVYFGCVMDQTDAARLGIVDATKPDLRVTTSSLAIGAGVATDDREYALSCDWSMDGARPLYVNGRPTAGAYQNPVRVFTLSDPNEAGITGKYYAADGETINVTLDDSYTTRNLIGATVDGETVLGRTIELSGSDWPLPCNREIPVVQLYATNWYVNAGKTDDAGNGFTPETAKKTLKGIMTADLRSGDVVHAAAGTYADETMTQTVKYCSHSADPTLAIRSRVVVPEGVTLVSDEGRDNTVIKGQWDANAADADYGCGPDAIRCVCLSDGAVLDGFTLQDGATLLRTVGSDNSVGGGVIARRADLANASLVRNCTMTNCTATRGGAGFGGRYLNCRMVGNFAKNNGTLRECAACNCYFDGNRSAQVIGYSYGDIVNCTFTENNRALTGAKQAGVSVMQGGMVANCVFLAPVEHVLMSATNNLFVAGATATVSAGKDNVIAEAGTLTFGANGAPVIGSCVAVDAADAAFYPFDAATSRDCVGNQRVWNKAMDMGAVEGDWRHVYAKDIKRSRCVVTEATAGVVETDAKTVRLSDGERLVAEFSTARTSETLYALRVNVSGPGVLTVVLNDNVRTWTVSDSGEQVLRFENALAKNTLSFGFSGDGSADVLGVKSENGMLLFVR